MDDTELRSLYGLPAPLRANSSQVSDVAIIKTSMLRQICREPGEHGVLPVGVDVGRDIRSPVAADWTAALGSSTSAQHAVDRFEVRGDRAADADLDLARALLELLPYPGERSRGAAGDDEGALIFHIRRLTAERCRRRVRQTNSPCPEVCESNEREMNNSVTTQPMCVVPQAYER